MKSNVVFGIVAFFVIWLVLFLYYLLYAGWIKLPNFGKKKSKVAVLEETKKKEEKKKKEQNTKKEELKHLIEVKFLMNLYHIDWRYLYFKRLLLVYAFLNAFIIVLTSEIIFLFKFWLILRLLIGFVLVLGLIYSLYSILGKILIMRGYDNNEHE